MKRGIVWGLIVIGLALLTGCAAPEAAVDTSANTGPTIVVYRSPT